MVELPRLQALLDVSDRVIVMSSDVKPFALAGPVFQIKGLLQILFVKSHLSQVMVSGTEVCVRRSEIWIQLNRMFQQRNSAGLVTLQSCCGPFAVRFQRFQ